MTGLIDTATSYEQAIEIIQETTAEHGIYFLESTLTKILARLKTKPSVVSIERGGQELADIMAKHVKVELNKMKMSHTTPGGGYSEKARHVYGPDMKKILVDGASLPVILVDCVVESQESILGAISHINDEAMHAGYPLPVIYTLGLISKIEDWEATQIPNFSYAFKVPKPIWVHGWGSDDSKESDRVKTSIWGRLGNGFKGTPPNPPYYTKNF